MRLQKLALGAAAAVVLGGAALAADVLTPDTPDPFLWLSDIHGAKPQAWIAEQNAKSFAVLKSDPDYKPDHDAILKVLNATDRIPEPDLHGAMVQNFWQDQNHVRGLWRQTTIADYAGASPHWDVLLDIDKLDADEHKQWVWQGAICSPSEERCLLRLSPGGGDASAVREFDFKARKFTPNGFTLDVAKSSASYLDDNTVLVATDFGPGSITKSSYPRIVKLWHRGEPLSAAKTVYEAGMDDVSAQPAVFEGPYGTVPLIVRGISAFESEYFYVLPGGTTMKLPLPVDANLQGVTNGNIIFILRKDWTPPGGTESFKHGSLIAFPVKPFVMQKMLPAFHVLYTPDARSMIDQVAAGRDAVYASIYENVIGGVHEFRLSKGGAWSDTKLNLPGGGSARVVSTNDFGPQAYFAFESFVKPPSLYAYSGTGAPQEIKSEPARFDASNLVSEQFEAKSADGTEVPYFYIHPKNTKGPIPTILYSYGGFELSLTPWYWNDGHRPIAPGDAWFSKGGAIVVANIRGGGEFGPAWHQAALFQNRQRAFDDFEGVAVDIAKRGFATPKQIGIVGASNGGLLVSTVMVQRPELFGAVVCQRPLIDMLRYTHFGAGASWVGEYGDPANPKDRAWILKYSPYELVKKDGHYPPAFFITETSDDRVTPVFARMMAAKMEDQGHNVLFYESAEGGHGPGVTNEAQAEMWALSYVYFAQKLGLENNLAPGAAHAPKH